MWLPVCERPGFGEMFSLKSLCELENICKANKINPPPRPQLSL